MNVISAVEVLRWQFGVVHQVLDVECGPAKYAQSVVIEDLTVNSILSGGSPLALSTWRGRTGLNRLAPLGRCTLERTWVDSVVTDRAELRLYAHAVYAATDAYLGSFISAPDRLTACVLTALLLSLNKCRAVDACRPRVSARYCGPRHVALNA
jgi:hypothetical protein